MKYLTKDFDWLNASFELKEFISQETWDKYHEQSYQFVSYFQVNLAHLVLKLANKAVYINTWSYSKNGNNYRGYRPPNCKVGAKFSLHKTSDALDFNVEGMTTRDVHKLIFDNHKAFWDIGVRRIEHAAHTVTWVHCDNKETPGQTKILVFKP